MRHFKRYFFETVIIFISVSLSFLLTEWRENVREKKLEKMYHQNLLVDIQTDSRNLKNIIVSNELICESSRELILQIENYEIIHKMDTSELFNNIDNVLKDIYFNAPHPTFDELTSTGRFALFENFELKKTIFRYYNLYDNIRRMDENYHHYLVSLVHPYLINNLALSDIKWRNSEENYVIKSNLLKN